MKTPSIESDGDRILDLNRIDEAAYIDTLTDDELGELLARQYETDITKEKSTASVAFGNEIVTVEDVINGIRFRNPMGQKYIDDHRATCREDEASGSGTPVRIKGLPQSVQRKLIRDRLKQLEPSLIVTMGGIRAEVGSFATWLSHPFIDEYIEAYAKLEDEAQHVWRTSPREGSFLENLPSRLRGERPPKLYRTIDTEIEEVRKCLNYLGAADMLADSLYGGIDMRAWEASSQEFRNIVNGILHGVEARLRVRAQLRGIFPEIVVQNTHDLRLLSRIHSLLSSSRVTPKDIVEEKLVIDAVKTVRAQIGNWKTKLPPHTEELMRSLRDPYHRASSDVADPAQLPVEEPKTSEH